MDYSAFRDYHEKVQADVTVALLEVDQSQGSEFGIAEVDNHLRIRAWEEKPKEPKPIPDDPERCLASMGIYLFRTDLLLDLLHKTVYDDFGGDIIPRVIDELKIYAYPYRRMNRIRDYIRQTDPDGVRRALGRSDPRLAVLEGCRYARRLLERQHGFDRRGPFFQPLWVPLACQDPSTPVPSGQVRFQPA
jgi:NDP-sugar pyrophosphorylase family protein